MNLRFSQSHMCYNNSDICSLIVDVGNYKHHKDLLPLQTRSTEVQSEPLLKQKISHQLFFPYSNLITPSPQQKHHEKARIQSTFPFSAAVNVSQLLVNRTRYCPLPLSPFLSDIIYILCSKIYYLGMCGNDWIFFSNVTPCHTSGYQIQIAFWILFNFPNHRIIRLCPRCHEAIICNTRTYVKPETHSYVWVYGNLE